MTDRLNKIFSVIPECEVFADVGCDHGYIAKAMLDSGKCKKAIISDISAKCLEKAEKLTSEYIKEGRAISVVSDGFENVEGSDAALIAGMGGEEIASILKRAENLPETLVLQPMKNCDKARFVAVKAGYKIISDRVFKSAGKFYDLIVLTKGKDFLTEEEAEFGRDNLENPSDDFKEMIAFRIEKLEGYAAKNDVKESVRKEMLAELEKLKKICLS